MRRIAVAALGALILAAGGGIARASVVDEWATVATPSPPPLKAVAADPATTALLVLDLLKTNCGPTHPRCVASLPHVATLLAAARAKHLLVVYSANPPNDPLTTTLPEVAPLGTEPTVVARSDKFLGTNLDDVLKAKGIKTVIVTGSSAHAAVLYTASAAALRGYNVIVPVDCMSADLPYSEQYTMVQLAIAPGISAKTTLTSSTMVTFAAP